MKPLTAASLLIRRFITPGSSNKMPESHRDQLKALSARVDELENRVTSYYRNRWDAIDNLADYLVGAEVPGDYLEFGVYKGTTFTYAYRVLSRLFPTMRFVAFDSFEGLPRLRGIDTEEGYSSGFYEGQFSCSMEEFGKTLRDSGVDFNRVRLIKGWFHQTLSPETSTAHGISTVAAAWIDCDLYESTVPVLRFLTSRLSVGSVLVFDDWRCFRNLPDFGQQRACREWLAENPQITLRELLPFGFHGQSFTVGTR